jgi:hypothetical protein
MLLKMSGTSKVPDILYPLKLSIMKPILKFAAYILLTGAVFFVACKKEKPVTSIVNPQPPPPPPIAKTKKARIVEYGTDLQLPGTTVDGWSRTGRRFQTVTDISGDFSFDSSEMDYLGMVTKAGYWKGLWNVNFDPQGYYLYAPISFFPGNSTFDYFNGGISSCDSFVVKLFPKKYITIHIKDSLGLSESNEIIFTVNGLFTQQGINQTVVSEFGGLPNQQNSWFNRLRPYIDTTFQYPVCGNAINIFTIGDYAFDSGWYTEYLRRDTILIPNSSNMILNITY